MKFIFYSRNQSPSYSSSNLLKTHLTRAYKSFPTTNKKSGREEHFECDICGRPFSQRQQLSIHFRTHTGEKPFKCDICSREFSQKNNLDRHYRSHTGEKPYECNICHKRFSQKNNLDVHERIHSGEKPFKCEICKRAFSLKCSLNAHLRTHLNANAKSLRKFHPYNP